MNEPQTASERGSVKAVWDQAAAGYDAERAADPVYKSCVDRLIARLSTVGTDLCLDAGCGTGFAMHGCLQRARLTVAMDFSFNSLVRLRSKFAGQPVQVIQGDLTRLPFPDGAFDQVICANTLQHLKPSGPQQQAVAELRRVTAAGGRVVISVHHYSKAKRKAKWVKEGKPSQAGIDYIFRFTREDFAQLLGGDGYIEAAGFYGLNRLGVGVGAQNFVARTFGALAARLGHGHMLVGMTKGTGRR
jgi:ubiquinone/menaquinone biosynthesis C-methylase UbiE